MLEYQTLLWNQIRLCRRYTFTRTQRDMHITLHFQVKDKFCLEFNEEEAVQHLQSLIDESVTAVMAVFVERIHKWAQYWRK